ncbi:MAG: methyltransferase domain-containing protein [ANME-2 cluster archaeon]|nr:methyltransferase domain-containing protein [ANME-2 cluster archaeon]
MNAIKKGEKLDFTIGDVNDAYEGPAGILWEMLMGEHIHVGGEAETDIMAQKAGMNSETRVLDICSALGGPARYLARNYGSYITGLDATQKMLDEATRRTRTEGLDHLVDYRLGNALDIPFRAGTFDVVLGQDAWCYITDKERLIEEAYRVLKPGGIIVFTDWTQIGNMTDDEWVCLNTFMVFPYMETLDGYETLLLDVGFNLIEKEDLSIDFARHCSIYQNKLRNELKDSIIRMYGEELFNEIDRGLDNWVNAAQKSKVGRGRIIGRKL